jgi:hypothetical protein
MSRRPTPETDAERREGLIRGNAVPTHVVPVEFAEELERERDEAREEQEKYKAWAEDSKRNAAYSVELYYQEAKEAKAIADDLAAIASHCLGSHSFASNDTAIKIAAALKRWKKSK